jgi:hypothetical protein
MAGRLLGLEKCPKARAVNRVKQKATLDLNLCMLNMLWDYGANQALAVWHWGSLCKYSAAA